jgi:hypothetical protein
MPKARKHAAHLSSNPNDLEAAFYEVLQAGDLEGGTINAHPEYITPGKCYGQPRNAPCSIRRAAARAGTALMQNRPLAPVYIA